MIIINTVWPEMYFTPVYQVISPILEPYNADWNLSAPLNLDVGNDTTVYTRLLMIKSDLTEQQVFLIKLKLGALVYETTD